MHWFDKLFNRKDGIAKRIGAQLIRYADDIRIYVGQQSPEVEEFLHATFEQWMGLTISKDKSSTVNLMDQNVSSSGSTRTEELVISPALGYSTVTKCFKNQL